MIGNRLEVGFGSFGRLAMGNAKGKMDNIASGGVPISWWGAHFWVSFVPKVGWTPSPFSSRTRGIWGSLLCDGWLHCRGTCNTKV
jgi:hypothetical protein